MITFEYIGIKDLNIGIAEKLWLNNAIRSEGFVPGEVSYQFCNDDYMLSQNIQYLNHDTYTDIITFDYNVGNVVNGSVLISVDRVRENSEKFGVDFYNELHRVLVHGAMHLCGYKDKTDEESKLMRQKENEYLSTL